MMGENSVQMFLRFRRKGYREMFNDMVGAQISDAEFQAWKYQFVEGHVKETGLLGTIEGRERMCELRPLDADIWDDLAYLYEIKEDWQAVASANYMYARAKNIRDASSRLANVRIPEKPSMPIHVMSTHQLMYNLKRFHDVPVIIGVITRRYFTSTGLVSHFCKWCTSKLFGKAQVLLVDVDMAFRITSYFNLSFEIYNDYKKTPWFVLGGPQTILVAHRGRLVVDWRYDNYSDKVAMEGIMKYMERLEPEIENPAPVDFEDMFSPKHDYPDDEDPWGLHGKPSWELEAPDDPMVMFREGG